MAKQPRQITPRLGRGLSALLSTPSAPAETGQAYMSEAQPVAPSPPPSRPPIQPATHDVPVHMIAPNPHQARRRFDPAEMAGLAASIAEHGILQPLVVTQVSDTAAERPYVLIAGERRLRAAVQAGLATVPCIFRQATDRDLLEWSLVENIQRSDLNPIERAQAYRDYMDRFGLTQADVGARTGQARATVANYLRLLDLCDDVQLMLLDGSLTFGHAKALAGLAGQPERQAELAHKTVAGGLSVRQVEAVVAAAERGWPAEVSAAMKPARHRPPYLVDLEERLTQAVGTRVAIRPGRAKDTGRIVVEYYSLDDFDRIARCLGLTGRD